MSDKSLIYFTMHRSASTFMADFLKALAKLSNKRYLNLDPTLEFLPMNLEQPYRNIPPNLVKNFAPHGFIYGPHRRFICLDGLENYNVILVLRDPRDVLVSLYYSTAYSHDAPHREPMRSIFLKNRRDAIKNGIDAYVLNGSKNILSIYKTYAEKCSNYNVLLLTYREMVTNFKSFLSKFLGHTKDMRFHQRLMTFDRFTPPHQENVSAHKRQILPGDYNRKLKKETINNLTLMYSSILDWLKL